MKQSSLFISVDEKLYRKIKIFASTEGITLKQFVVSAIEEKFIKLQNCNEDVTKNRE